MFMYSTVYQSTMTNAGLWMIVSFLVALCAGIVLYFTFLNPKNADHYTGFTKKIYDFLSFRTMSLEAILKICYLVIAIYVTIMSFSYIAESFIAFLLTLIIGNILVRLIFESCLLILMIHSRLVEISNKLPSAKEEKKKDKEEK